MSEKINWKKYIEENNVAFEAATAEEKRVMIAEDVIMRIKMKNINVSKGYFLKKEQGFLSTGSFKEFLNSGAENICEVCAKGALFCSLIGRVNEVKCEDLTQILDNGQYNLHHQKLVEYFSLKQLGLIETAFEGRSYLTTDVDRSSAYVFFNHYNSSNDRLIAICENIIANQGTFKP